MLLALAPIAAVLAVPALGIPAMAAIHGTVNALVFCLVGLAGWLLVRPAQVLPAGKLH